MADNIETKESTEPEKESLSEKFGKVESYFEQNKNVLYGVLGGIAAIILIYFGYKYYINEQNNEGQISMFQAIYYMERDSLKKALDGDGSNLGFIDIAADYSGTKAGNLANFYAGAAYLKMGKFQEAIEYLENFSSSDWIVQSRAFALIGDANIELGNSDDAAEYYLKAANRKPNKIYTPKYLMKAAFAYELQKDYQSALAMYQRIKAEFDETQEANEVEKYIARAEAMQGM
ncbi:MAG: hypothetical protein A3H98_04935 [Bacteroidetes bacterium RIFCSPLOWO2_02_FULL_36_8]|nr:MAG: hypothetical protein A3H98_04935 [Bacteroidetes bacterium RIFCSPLOWO2_02_FULL_36_8]OFY71822.1 MAG: hypothetical protein A3G23_14555 [Bacteroidetes bacterium RIFCSPLOWO2_12_FULL_37_12]